MLWTLTALAVAMTFVGGRTHKMFLSRETMSRLFSLRAGILLSVAFTEILPEAWQLDHAMAGWGALGAFALLYAMGSFAMGDSCPEYLEQCRIHYLGWTALFALSAHSFIDGFNLAVSFAAGTSAGLAVGLALALHKIADGFTLTSLFKQTGYDAARSFWLLAAVAAATPLGVALSALGFLGLPDSAEAALMGFAGGSFIYISAGDILPRLHKSRDAAGLAFFALGMAGMAALKIF